MTDSRAWKEFVAFCADSAGCNEDERQGSQVRTLAEARELRAQLERRVAELPEICRVVIGLYFCKGFDLEEIGQFLRIPRDELEWLFARALETMRRPRVAEMAPQEGVNHV